MSEWFLCWNLNKRPLQQLVSRLVRSEGVDVVVLIESKVGVGEMLAELNAATAVRFHHSPSPASMSTVQVFARFFGQFIRPIAESERYSIRHLTTPDTIDVLLVTVHSPSKRNWSEDSQAFGCIELASEIASTEERVGHSRTVVLGDLNMNPFEKGMVAASGLNATMARSRALKRTRTVQGRQYPFFYNPMWRYLGDRDGMPPGTYHYDNSQHLTYYWNMFDQVLVRPSLIDNLDVDRIRIVDKIAGTSLLTPGGVPNGAVGSDHLPLLFHLRL